MQASEPLLQVILTKALKITKCESHGIKNWRNLGWISSDNWLVKKKKSVYHVPEKNVTLCLSLLAFGLNNFIPSLWFDFEKFLMNVVSTLSRRPVTYN